MSAFLLKKKESAERELVLEHHEKSSGNETIADSFNVYI